MSPEHAILTPEERDELELTALVRHRLEEQFARPRAAARGGVAGHVGLSGDRGDVLRHALPRA